MRLGWLACIFATLALAGCTTTRTDPVSSAVTAPFNDLNLIRPAIPELLQEAEKKPYDLPEDLSCESLSVRIAALDEVLGSDIDASDTDEEKSIVVRGQDELGDAAVGALRSTTESVIPFRSWVRKLTGAEKYSKKVQRSIASGEARRSFLKGLKAAQKCEP